MSPDKATIFVTDESVTIVIDRDYLETMLSAAAVDYNVEITSHSAALESLGALSDDDIDCTLSNIITTLVEEIITNDEIEGVLYNGDNDEEDEDETLPTFRNH